MGPPMYSGAMRSSTYWKAVLVDREDFLERVLEFLRTSGVRYCVIGGTGVNAYSYPVVTEDLDIVVAAGEIDALVARLQHEFGVQRFEHSINVSTAGSKLQVQIQTDPRYFDFVNHAQVREVMDFQLPVARIEDILKGKVWAVMDTTRRASKRQKDLADIARILEVSPELRSEVPAEVLSKLL
jgi:hypothetical protein